MGPARPNAIGSWCKLDPTLLGFTAMTQQPFRPQVRGSANLLAWVCIQAHVSGPSTQGMAAQHQVFAAYGTTAPLCSLWNSL
jgi:hypothetical protein